MEISPSFLLENKHKCNHGLLLKRESNKFMESLPLTIFLTIGSYRI